MHKLTVPSDKKPRWWPLDGDIVLPILEGKHDYQYDIQHTLLSEELNNLLYQSICTRFQDYAPIWIDESVDMPIGINDALIRQEGWILEKNAW